MSDPCTIRCLRRRPSAWPSSSRLVSADHPDPGVWDRRTQLPRLLLYNTQYLPSRVEGFVPRQLEPSATFRFGVGPSWRPHKITASAACKAVGLDTKPRLPLRRDRTV